MEMKLSMLSASVKPKNMELPGVGFDIENARMGFPLGEDRTLISTSPVPSCTVCLETLINQNPLPYMVLDQYITTVKNLL